RDGDGWCVVDTGMNGEESRLQWLDIIEQHLEGKPLTRVIGTHHHPDHVGLAGWLCDRFEVPLFMSEGEYFYARTFNSQRNEKIYWEVEQFFLRSGMSEKTKQSLYANSDYNHVVSELPYSFHRVKDLQVLRIGNYDWLALTTRGHSPEHLSLYCKALDLYISGDQVLPKITSNVSVSPTIPEQNPLKDWYDSHAKIPLYVPDSVTVLPAHQLPFKGLHKRLHDVIAHHDERMEHLLSLCEKATDAQSLTSKLFDKELTAFQNFLAVGECLAHLHLLMEQGKVDRQLENGIFKFKRV
ncbi:MAG TPA: MBL fold metallo-hydrolase, partial [Pseudomonadales bacterium]|nr:MBL fold metallo-hydrolase [Pseudomonadales bacterium]